MNNIISSNKELSDLVNSSYDIFVLSEKDNDYFVMVNDRASEILGYTKEELMSTPYYEFMLKEDVEKTSEIASKIERDHVSYNFVNRYRTKNGNIVHLRWNSCKINGKFYNFAKVEEDIENMVLSQDNFVQLFNNSGTMIFVLDIYGRIIDVNKSVEKILGYPFADIFMIDFIDIIYQEDTLSYSDEYIRLSSTKEKAMNIRANKRFVNHENEIVYTILDMVVMRDMHGNPAYFVFQAQDITSLTRAEQRIERINNQLTIRNQNLESFAYAASHDLQEPLRKISSFSKIIKKQIEDNFSACDGTNDIYENLDTLISASKRMRSLIEDLLEYSRIGRFDFKIEKVCLAEVMAEVMDNLSVTIEERKAKIEIQDLPEIYANKTRMIQLFQNLLANSIKFSKKDTVPKISVSIECDDEKYLTICVRDNGIGFDMEFSEKIFRPFERLHARQEYKGSGMGLALCKSIVENLGGKIWATSVPGEGSSFFVTLSKIEGLVSNG